MFMWFVRMLVLKGENYELKFLKRSLEIDRFLSCSFIMRLVGMFFYITKLW